jgi:4-hydroxyacetophenone monooxygenase
MLYDRAVPGSSNVIVARELREASDEQIERAVAHAEPIVLRGLLFQLTGDEEVAATRIAIDPTGFRTAMMVAGEADIALLRAKAVALLRAHRDAGGGPLDLGPQERLRRSIPLTLGEELDDAELAFCQEELALDPWIRGLRWSAPPPASRCARSSATALGPGWAA